MMGATSTVIHGLPSLDDEEDLGWLACWASNDIGNQREPCLFKIVPAGSLHTTIFKIMFKLYCYVHFLVIVVLNRL